MEGSRKRVVEFVFVAAAFAALGFSGNAQQPRSVAACKWQRHDLKLRFAKSVSASVAVGPNSVWLGGTDFPRSSATPVVPWLVRWDGRRFSRTRVRIVEGSVVGMDASSASNVWAVGDVNPSNSSHQALALHWNGSNWVRRVVPRPAASGDVYLLDVAAISPRNAWAVGSANDFPLLEHWNGRAWRRVALPIFPRTSGSLRAISASSSSDIWAVGTLGTVGEEQPVAFRWNGARWAAATLPPVPLSGELWDVAALSPSSAWAVGSRTIDNGQDPYPDDVPYNIRFDGERWRSVPGVEQDSEGVPVPVMFYGVTAARPAQAWAWGRGDDTDSMLAHWEGGEWRVGPELPWPTHEGITAFNGSRNDFWVEVTEYRPAPAYAVERLAHYSCHP